MKRVKESFVLSTDFRISKNNEHKIQHVTHGTNISISFNIRFE